MAIKLKPAFKKHVVGFNNSGAALGDRDDLHVLLDNVIGPHGEIRDHYIAGMFSELPTRDELDEIKLNQFNTQAKRIQTRTVDVGAEEDIEISGQQVDDDDDDDENAGSRKRSKKDVE